MSGWNQLEAYLDAEGGKVSGRYYFLEVFEGGEQEHGVKGDYTREQDPATGGSVIMFSSVPEVLPRRDVIISSEEDFILGAIHVYSRKEITV